MSEGNMETEAQAKYCEEDAGGNRDSPATAAPEQYWCVRLWIAELVITVFAIGLATGAMSSPYTVGCEMSHVAIIYSAYSSIIIITGILIIARQFGETIGWRTSIGFCVLGVVMFTVAAADIFYVWGRFYYADIRADNKYFEMFLSSGVFAVIGAAVFLFHAFFTLRKDGICFSECTLHV